MKTKSSSLIVVLMVVVLSIALAAPVFAVPDDSIDSQHITEADGATGQDTDTGTGIKTGHIQNAAVTTDKIADAAITDAKIAGPISASKISSAGLDADTVDGVHASDFASAVHTHDILEVIGLDAILGTKADVTHNHDGVYSPAVHNHAQSDVTGLDSALASKADVSHNHDGLYLKKYANVIVVAKSGGDFTDPLAAVQSITDASETNPYLVKIMPGVYEVPHSSYFGKNYVDIEGSGREVTKLVAYNPGYMGPPETMIYYRVDYCELREITVEIVDTVGGGNQAGITLVDSSPRITNVDVIARGSHDDYGIWIWGGSPVLTNVNILIDGTGATTYAIHGTGLMVGSGSTTASVVYNGGAINVTNTPYSSYGINLRDSSTLDMDNVDVLVPGSARVVGFMGTDSTARFTNVDFVLNGGYAVQLYQSTSVMEATLYNSRIKGSGTNGFLVNGGAVAYGAGLQMEVSSVGNITRCLNCFDGSFNPIP